MNPEQLSITDEQLFAIIGRLHVENLALRTRLAALSQAQPMEVGGSRAGDSPSPVTPPPFGPADGLASAQGPSEAPLSPTSPPEPPN